MTPNKSSLSPLALVLTLSAVFFVFFLIVSGAVFYFRSPGSGLGGSFARMRGHGNSALFATGSVGVVEINGVIMDSKKTLRRLEDFEDDDDIRAVVLRLNSPGGAVAPSQEIYQAVRNYKKPLVVSMSSVAASGAFYIACGAKKVIANPGTLTGSIGVIMEFLDLQKLYEWAKVQRYAIKTGKFKDVGAEYRPMTADERALMQTMVDDVLLQFKQAVAVGRNLSMEQVTKIADGRIMSGSQAKAVKLVDELGTLDDAIEVAAKMAHLKGKPSVVYPEKSRHRLLDLLLDDNAKGDEDEYEGEALDSAFPRSLRSLIGLFVHPSRTPTAGAEAGIYWLWNGPR